MARKERENQGLEIQNNQSEIKVEENHSEQVKEEEKAGL